VCWKPLLWYVKNRFPKERHYGFLKDKLISKAREKDLHEWQQSIDWAMYLMGKVTEPGELVFDPFCGSGTFLEAAERLGRKWIGVDIDETAVQATITRLQRI
jgi:DNA modification methylase